MNWMMPDAVQLGLTVVTLSSDPLCLPKEASRLARNMGVRELWLTLRVSALRKLRQRSLGFESSLAYTV